MNPIQILARSSIDDLTPEEESALSRELTAAYHMDEAAASSLEVQRIAEKVRGRMDENRRQEAFVAQEAASDL